MSFSHPLWMGASQPYVVSIFHQSDFFFCAMATNKKKKKDKFQGQNLKNCPGDPLPASQLPFHHNLPPPS